MLATNRIMTAVGIVFLVAALLIWLAPKPTRVVDAFAERPYHCPALSYQ
ncbi:MAG: hypothetical protein H6R17_2731 [Proteobacteria bacterium]|nr:hypothetical protein [Pseudomonadota bacterium]